MSKEDGGSAFPEIATDDAYNSRGEVWANTYSHGGMSLRDYIAVAAMPVMWSMTEFALNAKGALTMKQNVITEKTIAEGAYALADAMLAERSKRETKHG